MDQPHNPNHRTVHALLAIARQTGLDREDADALMLHALRERGTHNSAWLRSHADDPLSDSETTRFQHLCEQRRHGVPVAYLTGQKPFYGLDLHIDARVLDPRPDTETLVDWALELLAATPAPRVADLGTGSGAIALAIQHQRPDAQVLAVDASADALAVAQTNAERLKLPISCLLGNWLEPLPDGQQHMVVSNPPYIAEGDPHLPALRHEPTIALTSGPDGLNAIRHIVTEAPRALRPGGWLLLEHGFDQHEAVQTLLQARGFCQIGHRRDLGNHIRCTGGRWLGGASTDN